MDPPIEIEDSPDQRDYPIILVDVFNPVEIDLPKQTDEDSKKKRKNWVDAIWNIDQKKFPLLKYRMRFGKDPPKDSVVWKHQKVADILRKHFSSLKAVKCTETETPSATPSKTIKQELDKPIKQEIDIEPPSCQVDVTMEDIDTDFRKTYVYPDDKSTSSLPKIQKKFILKRKFEPIISSQKQPEEKISSSHPEPAKKIVLSHEKAPLNVRKEKLVQYSDSGEEEEEIDYRNTYVFPTDGKDKLLPEQSEQKAGLRMTVETNSDTRSVKSISSGTSEKTESVISQADLEESDLRNVIISARLREAKMQSMYVLDSKHNPVQPKVPISSSLPDVSLNSGPASRQEYETDTLYPNSATPQYTSHPYGLPIHPQSMEIPTTHTNPQPYKAQNMYNRNEEHAPQSDNFLHNRSRNEHTPRPMQPMSAQPSIMTSGNDWEIHKNSLDQFANRKGKNLFSSPISQMSASRDCLLCHIRTKDMKKHTILNHLSNTWWGAYGSYTCWRCQEFHPGGEIVNCGGQFTRSDLPTFLYRNKCLENFLKEDLECGSDQDLVNLARRNGLCSRSGSNFSDRESSFLREIDLSKGLVYKPIYSATNPTRISELYHWKTMAEILQFSNYRGIISGNICPSHPINLIDSMVNLPDPYMLNCYRGKLSDFIKLNSPFPNKTSAVITDLTGDQLLDQGLLNKLLTDDNIRLSVGICPKDADHCSNSHIEAVERLLTEPKTVAIGSTGLDCSKTASLGTQTAIFTTMMGIAKRTKKPIRIFSINSHHQTLKLMVEHLPKKHKIHYSNPTLTYCQAVEFLRLFPEGYVGIFGRNVLVGDPGHEIIQRLNLKKVIPASYAFMDANDSTLNRFDLERIVIQIGIIKRMSRHEVAKNLRVNIKNLYQF